MTFSSPTLFRRFSLWLGLAALAALTLAPTPDRADRALREEKTKAPSVAYRLTPKWDAEAPYLQVEMSFVVTNPSESVRLQMPVWSPGDYHYQNHGKYVQNVRARGKDNSGPVIKVEQEDTNTWRVEPDGNSVLNVTYTVSNSPPGFFSENVKISRDQLFVNGPAALMYVVGQKESKATLYLRYPEGLRIEMPLPSIPAKFSERAILFHAENYDELADSPLVVGRENAIKVKEFSVGGKPHQAVFFGSVPREMDCDAWVPVLKRIVEAETKLMGEMPYSQYTFFFDVNGRGGGLEHTNSARLAIHAGSDPKNTAGFIAHEFFHLWNVKRIRPRVLGPFDYITPPKTRNLWFAEGVTEYYAQIATRRAGLMTEDDFLNEWRSAIRWYQQVPARRRVSADESSLRVWEANNSSGYGGLNYYQKGELIGLCLDLKIRQVTENRRSLDDVMRELFKRTNPPKPGYEEDEIREAVNLIAGQDLTKFYDLLARSTEEMPFAECLSYAGLDTNLKELPNVTAGQAALRKSWMRGE